MTRDEHPQTNPPSATEAPDGPDRPLWQVLEGDCLGLLHNLADRSVDAVVCDPPYGIDFQNAGWDGPALRHAGRQHESGRGLSDGQAMQAWTHGWATECLRILQPGGHLVAFGAPRTFHRLTSGLEDAGFQLRDTLMWLYGTGMPKSRRYPDGQGTGLKPGWEPIVLARKPPVGTIAANIARYGTGGLNINACRGDDGRFPPNVVLSHDPGCKTGRCMDRCPLALVDHTARSCGASGRASRLFYSPKASRRERNQGCDGLPARTLDLFPQARRPGGTRARVRNAHPTVRPIAVMRWLVRLVTPPDGLVLDPFCGSGTTGAAAVLEDRRFLGIEREAAYTPIARARIKHWSTGQPETQDGAGDPFAPAAEAAR